MTYIKQVKEFMLVGSNDNRDQVQEETAESLPPQDPFAGPRSWKLFWNGPYFSENIPANCAAGLYLIYVGNYPVYVSSSKKILMALNRHLMFSGRQAIPIDLLGREILYYSTQYHQPLNIKTALIYEDGRLIEPVEHIQCYRRAAAAIAYCHGIPCNKYASVSYEFEPLTIENDGKFFPLKPRIHAESLLTS